MKRIATQFLRHKRVFTTETALGISPNLVNEFKSNGFVVVENFFDEDEFNAIKLGLIELRNLGRLANVSTENDGITHCQIPKNLQLCPLSPEASVFKSLPFNTKIGRTMQQLLCDNENEDVCQYLSQCFWKPSKHGEGTGIHQDNAYFKTEQNHYGTAMWIPIHKATKENGTLRVVKGYGNGSNINLPHERDLSSDHHITCKNYINSDDIIELEVNECGVAFFNYSIPHGTGPNNTEHDRAAVAFHFLNTKEYVDRQFPLPDDTEYVTPIIYGPNNSNGLNEYGYSVGNDKWLNDKNEILKRKDDILTKYQQNLDMQTREVKQDIKY